MAQSITQNGIKVTLVIFEKKVKVFLLALLHNTARVDCKVLIYLLDPALEE